MKNQHTEKQHQGRADGNPASARQSYSNSRQDYERSVAQQDFGYWRGAAGQGVCEPQRQKHFQKAAQVIGRNISSRAAVRVAVEQMPDMLRTGEKLIERIERNRHRQKNHRETDELDRFLPMQIIENGEKQESIYQNLNQFLTGNIFNIGRAIPDNRIDGKRQHGPANRRPQQALARIKPDTAQP